MREAGRNDRRGGKWSGVGEVRYVRSNDTSEVRYARSSGASEMSSNDLVKVRVRVRERMGGSLARYSESEWVRGI